MSAVAAKITVDTAHTVSGLLDVPAAATAGYVLAHGAGAGMHHPFMATVAAGLAERELATACFGPPSGYHRPAADVRS